MRYLLEKIPCACACVRAIHVCMPGTLVGVVPDVSLNIPGSRWALTQGSRGKRKDKAEEQAHNALANSDGASQLHA